MSSRALNSSALAEMLSQETSEQHLWIVEIDNTDLASPVRLVNDSDDLVSNGDTYTAMPFMLVWPPDRESEVPRGRLVIDATDGTLVAAARSVTTALDVTATLVRKSAPDTAVLGPTIFQGRALQYQATLTLELSGDPTLLEPWPYETYSPANFPGLFDLPIGALEENA